MCGIFFSLSTRRHVDASDELLSALRRRGPDACNTIHLELESQQHGTLYLTFTSTVLSLRGADVTKQPIRNDTGSILCWNGEAWSINGERPQDNDTRSVFDTLQDRQKQSMIRSPTDLVDTLSTIAGPYAFVFYDKSRHQIHFGRDLLGRRSLLYSANEQGDFHLSSISSGSRNEIWQEVEADGTYSIHLSDQHDDSFTSSSLNCGGFSASITPYRFNSDSSHSVLPSLALNKSLPIVKIQLDENSNAVSQLEILLQKAVLRRVQYIPDPPSHQSQTIPPARLAILFSGGLDCTVLARLAHDALPTSEPIELLNVAFRNPRVHQNSDVSVYELCPDRITGRASFAELLRVCPGRKWRFIAANIPYEEFVDQREKIIALMYPHNTEMDLSIAAALYFASRGSGKFFTHDGQQVAEYSSSARVLLSGLGADEVFAGYTRHSTAFRRGGYEALFAELDLDVGRLGKRNLGRDDRVISSWSKETRFPFLDEELLTWALAAPINDKCGFGDGFEASETSNISNSSELPPEKKVLRCLAWKLGMTGVAKEKKRAIQFGARTAKMQAGKTKGTTLLT